MPNIYILISNKGTSQEKLDSSQPNGGVAANNDLISEKTTSISNIFFKTAAMHQLMQNTINMAKTMITDSVSMYGEMTGEYLKQTKIENIFKTVGTATSFVGTVAAGAMTGGVAGAVVGAVIATGNLVYSQVKSNINYSNSIVKSNIQASFNSQRIGNVLIGGGRI